MAKYHGFCQKSSPNNLGLVRPRFPAPALPRRVLGTAVTAVIALAAWYPPVAWDAAILTSGPYLHAEDYKKISDAKKNDLRAAMKADRETLFIKDGLHAVVSLLKAPEGDRLLQVDGKTDASAKNDAAASHYHYAIKLYPKLVSAHMNFGNLLLAQNKFEQAKVSPLLDELAGAGYRLSPALCNRIEELAEWI